ncbi:MAG: glycosyltransferase 87 family protein [Myxococcota bacterium]|nr:glycosyltransferase 87 family protein [Myxococcota bacterium]
MLAATFALFSAVAFVWLGDPRPAAPQAVSILLAWGLGVLVLKRPQGGATAVLVTALLVRGVLLLGEPGLSDDLYRYLWEGQVTAAGGNPYIHAPADPIWDGIAAHDPIRAAVNHPRVPSIYPPLALELFAVLAKIAYAPLSIRCFMALCDAGTAFALARLMDARGDSRSGAWLYALMPLGAIEAAHGGHLEAAALLPLVVGLLAWERGRPGLGWVGLAALVKLLPALVLPALWRRSPWLLVLVGGLAALTALPFVDGGSALATGLATYARHWSFNGSLHPLLEVSLGEVARPICVGIAALMVGGAWWRHRDPARIALWVGAAFVLCSPTVHPWYVLWVWVPALVVGVRAWTLLAWLVPVAYIALATMDPATGQWQEARWPALVQYIPLACALAMEWWRHWTRPGPWAPGPLAAASRSRFRT